MFTDTKNLANLTVNTTNATSSQQINSHNRDDEEDKFKLRKMWKPILRLMCRKSALVKNGKRDNNICIPNNINLNNATQCSSNTAKDSLAALEESSFMTHKLPLAEFWQGQQPQPHVTTQKQPLEIISKASIEKTPLDTCKNCIYGRNCRHTQFHPSHIIDPTVTAQLQSHHHLNPYQQKQSFNYFDTEEGCFVWSDNATDLEENVLREWLWRNSLHFEEKATVC